MLYHENSLTAIQCSFLTGVYNMLTFQILAGWKCFVHASNQCLAWLLSRGWTGPAGPDVGANLLAVESQKILACDPSTRHVVESLYWSCLKSEQ